MKRTWVVMLVAVASVIPTMALAEGPEPIAAWCGGSYGAEGTNFGECVRVEVKGRVAGASTGTRDQMVLAPTYPEYPSSSVVIEGSKAVFHTGKVDRDGKSIAKELYLRYVAAPDRSGDLQAPGND